MVSYFPYNLSCQDFIVLKIMIKPLTSLRFLFAFIVFLSHLDYLPKEEIFFNQIYKSIFKHGSLGVSFFFILSGFILSYNYKNKILSKEVTFKDFWIARIARIYPLHLFTLFLSLPIFFTEAFNGTLLWVSSFLSNLLLLQSYIPNEKIYFGFNAVSWSISNELFYYMAFPFLISVFYKYSKTIFLSLLLLLVIPIGIYLSPTNVEVFVFGINPLLRITDFIIGILLFRIYENKIFEGWFKKNSTASLLEIITIGIFIVFFSFRNEVPGGYRLSSYYWFPMSLIILVHSYQRGLISRFLSHKHFILLGKISFSFYMLHGLVMRYLLALERRLQIIQHHYIMMLIIFLTIILLSYIVYRTIELPANRYLRNLSRKNRHQEPVISKEEEVLVEAEILK